ncbi:MAG: PfkB family carbohydrate kinase, partial [Bacteroidota bacterium]|nr:PfkB family carbohydrate kinase [Candidatus Kapabacteria bacterium]MDW8221231.1 PfkB family carbohydrate kinase [Bacteroidota bacterium]
MEIPSIERTSSLLIAARAKRIAVVGDVMLDRYFWGSVQRISPEAPVPVVDIEHESAHLGGAANVAANIQALGAEPLMLGIIGDDDAGSTIIELMRNASMSTIGLVTDSMRPTTVKTRILGNNQHIARLDRETRAPIEHYLAERLLNILQQEHTTKRLAGLVLQDYNKGVLTSSLIRSLISFAQAYSLPVFADPKQAHFFDYRNVTLFKPNRKETQDALGFTLAHDNDIRKAGTILLERLSAENVLITLGAQGMMLFERNGTMHSIPTKARRVADVSGAGDTAIATLA